MARKPTLSYKAVDKHIEGMVRLLLSKGCDPLWWSEHSILDTYIGPWETYRQLVQKSEIQFSNQSTQTKSYSTSLIRLAAYFSSDLVVARNLDHLWEYVYASRGFKCHLGFSHRYRDLLASRMLPLIKNGADVHGYPEDIVTSTPLQLILLFNIPLECLHGFLTATSYYCPENEISTSCMACAHQRAIAQPPVDEWLNLLKSAGIDLIKYGEEELAIWNILSLIKSSHNCTASWHLRLYDDKHKIGLVKDFKMLQFGDDGVRLPPQKIGTFQRLVQFHIDPNSD